MTPSRLHLVGGLLVSGVLIAAALQWWHAGSVSRLTDVLTAAEDKVWIIPDGAPPSEACITRRAWLRPLPDERVQVRHGYRARLALCADGVAGKVI